jgi:hypothetical protein
MTRLSATLKSWYLVFLSSLVVFGTCIDMYVRLGDYERDDSSFGVALGVVSTTVAFFFILVHYDFLSGCEEGGWFELASSFFLIMLWTIGLAILTQDQGIAASMEGSQCSRDQIPGLGQNCTIVMWILNKEEGVLEKIVTPCTDLPRQVPGSNLYFATWTCFFASLNVTFRWKAAQALHFAQAHQEKERRRLEENDKDGEENSQSSLGDDVGDDDAI